MLFDPLKDSQGLFPANGFQQERRQLLEMLDAEFNDKVGYAHQRCEEILFQGRTPGLAGVVPGRMWRLWTGLQ